MVFGLDRAGVKSIAVAGARIIRDCAAAQPETYWVFQYSPESFTGTELDFAREGLNEGFKFNNPNERDRCGCGESFRI